MRAHRVALALALLLPPSACGGHDEHGHDHDGAHGDHAHAGHAHAAPHGGLLISLGAEEAHVELALDPAAGTLTAWLLDAEAEAPRRSAQDALVVRLGEGAFRLAPVASALTGESAGDTSQFHVEDPALVGATLAGVIERVEIQGFVYADVPIESETR